MQFVNPPAARRRESNAHWRNVARELKANPQQWGLVGNYSIGVATHIRNGRYPAFTEEWKAADGPASIYMEAHWEVTTRKTPDGRNDVYVRWLG